VKSSTGPILQPVESCPFLRSPFRTVHHDIIFLYTPDYWIVFFLRFFRASGDGVELFPFNQYLVHCSLPPGFSTHIFSGTVTVFLFSDKAEGLRFLTSSFNLKKGTKYPGNVMVTETSGMMGNVQNVSHKDSSFSLYPEDNVMCPKFDTIFLFRMFKFFYYASLSGQP
jgi:hypothetical protein